MKILTFATIFLFIVTAHPNQLLIKSERQTTDIAYIFSHGLGGNYKHAHYYFSEDESTHWLINKPLITFDFPDVVDNVASNPRIYDSSKVTLGQHDDIECLKNAYNFALNKLPDHKFVGVGVSRGAATLINFCALYQPAQMAALILESPFDTPLSVFKYSIRYLPGADYIAQKIGKKIIKRTFPSWDECGIAPFDVVDKISTTIPILIFHSKRDKLIPWCCSYDLAQKLANSDHDVYFLPVEYGTHANVFFQQERDLITNIVHAFYKKYKLPHHEEYALAGNILLESYKVEKSH